jgi:hypothetical protein
MSNPVLDTILGTLCYNRRALADCTSNTGLTQSPRSIAFGLRQQGTFSFRVAGFSPGRAKNQQQKNGIYRSAEGQNADCASRINEERSRAKPSAFRSLLQGAAASPHQEAVN